MSKTKKNGGSSINLDIVKRDAAERRKQDIEMHGKPTAFRPSITKNKKAYSRKEKHKVSLTEADLNLIIAECIAILKEEEFDDGLQEMLSIVDRDFEYDVNEVMTNINDFLSQFGLSAKFNKRYDFSGYYSDCVAVYQYRSVKRNGCMRMSVNKNALKKYVEEEFDDFFRYEYVFEQIAISLWHECAHGLIEWIKQKRRLDTQQGTGIFKGKKLSALRELLSLDEEDVAEEFAEEMVFGSTSSDLLKFVNKYMK